MNPFCVPDSRPLDWWGSGAGKSSPAVGLLGQRRPPQRGRYSPVLTPVHWLSAAFSSNATDSGWTDGNASSFLRLIWFIRGVLFVRVWGQPKYLALTVGFASRLSAGLVGQPADHMDLLGLQPHSKFNILLPSCFPPNCNLLYCILPCPALFSRDMQRLSHW